MTRKSVLDKGIVRAASLLFGILSVAFMLIPAEPADARELGGLNLQGYCDHRYSTHGVAKGGYYSHGTAVLIANHARGWRCHQYWALRAYPTGVTYAQRLWDIDLNDLCRWQYGRGARPYLKQNQAQGWRCRT